MGAQPEGRGEGRLLVGFCGADRFTALELADEEKPAVLRAYLKRWKFEVGVFFDGVGPEFLGAGDARSGAQASGFSLALRQA